MVGKGGATLRKIREETDTRIELPQENSESDVIVIIGRKENVQKAHERLLAIEKDMVRFYFIASKTGRVEPFWGGFSVGYGGQHG